MGLIFYARLTGISPFPLGREGYPDTSKPMNLELLREKEVPEDIIELIQSMLTHKSEVRSSAAEALEKLTRILRFSHSQLWQQIADDLALTYY